ncbi:DUF2799 domain-containing protein [Aliivibrio sifiae]|uniref:DUF2799 domain-containing protein n=1 Tax=Aliivibrio sifiae TaxID=566293 RepID=A0A2S7XD14_9GAMM|nr:DUF2799 domain-containing protein [Aliivibrio sifiae]PQJ89032.1 hypothetical protein BTO22_05280 [Aliivibrio sifiae]
MRKILIAVVSLFLAACSSMAPLTSTQDSDWGTYGLERGEKGWNFESKEQIVELLDGKEFKVSNYDAYVAGYNKGLQEYCGQDAFELGAKGGIYTGVCDSIDENFKFEYLRGYHSEADKM